MKPVPATSIRVCGLLIPVAQGSAKDHPDLKKCWGVYDHENEIVWMNEATPKDKVPFWETHEALHALVNKSGLLYVTAAIFGAEVGDDKMEAWEEAFIRVATPHVLETFGGPRRVKS